MKCLLLPLTLALAAAVHADSRRVTTIAASHPEVIYEGRTAPASNGGIAIGFPGVTAHLRFRGSQVDLSLAASAGPQYLDVIVDGGPRQMVELHQGEGSYTLWSGKPGAHSLAVLRRNESWQGTLTLHAFEVSGGRFLPPPPVPARKFLFIGDSVTCGEMTDFQAGREFSDRRNSEPFLSYGMRLARRFQAQCQLVSYGGKGIIRDWTGDTKPVTAPQFYDRALPDSPEPRWAPGRYVPDAIGVQLGTNDFSSGIPDRSAFCDAYVALLRRLRTDAPHALILVMNSPIVGGAKADVLRKYLDEIIHRAADPRIVFAPVSHYAGVPGNGHPTGEEHGAMARELEPVLRRFL